METTIYPVKDGQGKVTNAIIQHIDATERQLAQEALLDAEETYRSLFDRSLDGVLLTEPDGVVCDANPAACRLLGMTKEEICAAGRKRLVVPSPELDRAVEERERAGSTAVELTFVRKDGSEFRAEVMSSLIPPRGQGRPRAFVMFRDISERKKAEEALRQSEARLLRAQAVAGVGDWEIDLVAGTLWASGEALHLCGLERPPGYVSLELARSYTLPGDDARLEAPSRTCSRDEPHSILSTASGGRATARCVWFIPAPSWFATRRVRRPG